MHLPFFQRLSVRLAGLILIPSGLALLLLTEINRRSVERILSEQAEVQAAMAIAGVVDGLDAVAGSAERITHFVARELSGSDRDYDGITRLARGVLLDNPNLHGFAIAYEPDADGRATGSYVHRTNAPDRFVTRDLATQTVPHPRQDWYREVIQKGHPVWGEPFFDREGADRNVLRIAVPIYRQTGDEKPVGVASALIELDWLRRLANSNDFADTTQIIVFSRTGRIILHPKSGYIGAETIETIAEKTGSPELADIRQNIIARRQGSSVYTEGTTGRRLHATYKPARTGRWGVVVAYEEAEFLASLTNYRRIAAGFIGSALLVLAGTVIVVTWRALRPLGRLADAAGEIGRTNLNCDIPKPTRHDEVGHLARSFSDMRDALKAQHLERSWAAQGIEHQLRYNNLIIESIGELVFVLTKALNISRINAAVTKTTGYQSIDLLRMPVGQLLVPAENAVPDEDPILSALAKRDEIHGRPYILTNLAGDRIRGQLTMVPIIDSNRVVGCVVSFRRDPASSR